MNTQQLTNQQTKGESTDPTKEQSLAQQTSNQPPSEANNIHSTLSLTPMQVLYDNTKTTPKTIDNYVMQTMDITTDQQVQVTQSSIYSNEDQSIDTTESFIELQLPSLPAGKSNNPPKIH
ncbi:27287_t:CDS:1 [Dentiscutata erythropus]|uniref:27287_t:CDS:1 n=1 Tax=Dentiscutata erythropus TaxID=1348616 RepID=A0A9N9I5G6_9GLOM|nr:27287_t:CDS:1 [Dentiscutata erythropus]